MTQAETEALYEALAQGIDAAGPARAQVFLAKAALLLARDLGDAARALALIAEAGRDLDPPSGG